MGVRECSPFVVPQHDSTVAVRRCSWVRRMSCDTLVTPRASAVVPVSAQARCDTDRVSSAEFARDTRQTNVEIISLRLFNRADAAGA